MRAQAAQLGRRLAEPRRFLHPDRKLLVGESGVPLEEFLTRPVEHWLRR